jgi:hypothetical protein
MICLKERIGREDAEEAEQLAAQDNVSQLTAEHNVCADAHVTKAAAENAPPCVDISADRAAARPSCITARAAHGADISSQTSDTAEVVLGNHADATQTLGQEQGNSPRPLRELPWREVCEFLRALDIDEPGMRVPCVMCHVSCAQCHVPCVSRGVPCGMFPVSCALCQQGRALSETCRKCAAAACHL